MESQGAKLKKIRLEKGLSLEEAQKKTKIHLNILKAMEGDGITDLSPVYLKGFLKIYCKFLGLDPKDYISDYKGPPRAPLINATFVKGAADKPLDPFAFIRAAATKVGGLRAISKKLKPAFVFILIAVILTFGLFNLGKFISHKIKSRPKLTRQAATPVVSPSKTKTAPVKKETQIPAPIKKEVASGIRLGIRARENCWVSLKVDGKVVFHRVLEKGRFESWSAKDKIELTLGNARGVELEVNGQLFSALSRKAQERKSIVITKEGLNITR